jgi:hypothetical protein
MTQNGIINWGKGGMMGPKFGREDGLAIQMFQLGYLVWPWHMFIISFDQMPTKKHLHLEKTKRIKQNNLLLDRIDGDKVTQEKLVIAENNQVILILRFKLGRLLFTISLRKV